MSLEFGWLGKNVGIEVNKALTELIVEGIVAELLTFTAHQKRKMGFGFFNNNIATLKEIKRNSVFRLNKSIENV